MNLQEFIAWGDSAGSAAHGTKFLGVGNNDRGNQVVVLGLNEVCVKADELIASGNALLLFYVDIKSLAAQFHGV